MSQSAVQGNSHPPVTAYDPPPGLDAAIHAVPLVVVSKKPKKVGYLTNYSFHIWYQIVIEILKRRGAQYGVEVEAVEAGLSVENQIKQAREMIGTVDAIILTPANTEGLEEILKMAAETGTPVLVEANPVEGMVTMVAICDYDAGYDLGVWVGNNVKRDDGPLRILDVGFRGCGRVCSAVRALSKASVAFSQMQSLPRRSTARRRRPSLKRSHAKR